MAINSSIIKGLPPRRNVTEIHMAKGHLQSPERNGKVECVVTAVAFCSTETGGQRVGMMMTEGKYPGGFLLQWLLEQLDLIATCYDSWMATGITQALTD